MDIYVIGRNDSNQLGIFDGNSEADTNKTTLQKLKHPDINNPITNICSGLGYTIFSNDNQQFWCCGDNDYGQCGVGNDKSIAILREVQFFRNKNIIIDKVCINVVTTWWITRDNKIYGNGYNCLNQLGLDDDEDKFIPELIDDLQNVVDVTSTSDFSIALSISNDKNASKIIRNWSRLIGYYLSDDIINLITIFCKMSDVYCTKGGNRWNLMETLENKNISKISSGFKHCLFLTTNGSVWGFGANNSDQIGVTDYGSNYCDKPVMIDYFATNSIKIKDICSGYRFNLLLDFDGGVYAFGDNFRGQCGDGTLEDIVSPKLIQALQDYKIKTIECGAHHSYCLTLDNKHFLFGSNEQNECITYNGEGKVTIPYCINNNIKQKCDGKVIKCVFMGYYNTQIIVSANN